MNRKPPRKKKGQGKGRREIDGAILDIKGTAAFLGCTEETVRARIERQLLPHRRWGGRVICVRADLEEFLRQLEGVSVDEAVANLKTRNISCQ